MPRSKGRLTLPDNPNLEQLRAQAKDQLDLIRTHTPDAQLSDAQFALAKDYGFSGWRALKAEVDRRSGGVNGLVGCYAYGEEDVFNNIFSVTAKGQSLLLERGLGAKTEIVLQPDGAFVTPGLTTRYRFERDSTGKAHALIIESEAGAKVRAARIGAEQAAQMRSEREHAANKPWRARASIEVPDDALERCAGYYADPLGGVMVFSREDHRLFMGTAGERRVALAAETAVDFFQPDARLAFHFRVDGDAATSVVVQRLGSGVTVLSRVSPEAAASLRSIVVQRSAEQAQPRQLAAPVPPEILARYAGRYIIQNGLEMLVEVEESRIFAQVFGPTGRPPRLEIFPESDAKFFWTAMAAQVSFFADREGRVAYGIWHARGHLIPMSRMEEPPDKVAPAA